LAATSDNLLLLAIFFGLYLLDCVVLLRPAQALAVPKLPRGKGRRGPGIAPVCAMDLDFGLTVYPVRGRCLAVLNPLTPFVAVFKTRPIDAAGMGDARPLSLRQILSLRLRMRRMSVTLFLHGVLLFVVLPLLLLSGQTDRLLIALGAAFLSALLILWACYMDRRAARLPLAGFWGVAGQALLCLPTSLNAPRKLALLAPAAARSLDLLPRVPADRRERAVGELRLLLDRAADDGVEALAQAAEAQRHRLAADFPEA